MTECLRTIALVVAIFAVLVIVAVAVRLRGMKDSDFVADDIEDWYE